MEKKNCTQLIEKDVISKHILIILYFSFPNVTFLSALQLCFKFFGVGFRVRTVVRIYNAVWKRTL